MSTLVPMLATASGSPGGSGVEVILPAAAELVLLPAMVLLVIAVAAGWVIWFARRAANRGRADLEARLGQIEAENAELRAEVDRLRDRV